MKYINSYQAKTHLSGLLTEVEEDKKEIILCRHNKPIAKLIPISEEEKNISARREFGLLKGQITIQESFFDNSDEIEEWNKSDDILVNL